MGTTRTRGIPAELAAVRRRFEDWRRTRASRTRIPEPLWTAAGKVAGKHGIHRAAKVLRLDYYRLKKRVEAEPIESSTESATADPTTAFVALACPIPPGSAECLVEWEDAGGSKMRVHLKGIETPDLIALSRSFWGVLS